MSEDIPENVRDILTSEELDNIRDRTGWAIGTVVLAQDGEIQRRIQNAVIELFNGDGQSGDFGGVKFLADDGGLEESYAFATKDAFLNSSQDQGWYVEEFTDPKNPDYGQPAP